MTAPLLARDLAESLDRLRTDYVDLYLLHRDDPRVPVDEIMEALAEHQRAGRIRHYGASNWRPERIEQAQAYARSRSHPPFVASQVQWNLAELTSPQPPDLCIMDGAQESWYRSARLPVWAYSSTARGYFARDSGSSDPGAYDNPVSRARRERAIQLGRQWHATPTQVALAYLMSQPVATVPILGTMNPGHLEEELHAADIRLTPEQVRWLRDG